MCAFTGVADAFADAAAERALLAAFALAGAVGDDAAAVGDDAAAVGDDAGAGVDGDGAGGVDDRAAVGDVGSVRVDAALVRVDVGVLAALGTSGVRGVVIASDIAFGVGVGAGIWRSSRTAAVPARTAEMPMPPAQYRIDSWLCMAPPLPARPDAGPRRLVHHTCHGRDTETALDAGARSIATAPHRDDSTRGRRHADTRACVPSVFATIARLAARGTCSARRASREDRQCIARARFSWPP
jgi:hypothetical protein